MCVPTKCDTSPGPIPNDAKPSINVEATVAGPVSITATPEAPGTTYATTSPSIPAMRQSMATTSSGSRRTGGGIAREFTDNFKAKGRSIWDRPNRRRTLRSSQPEPTANEPDHPDDDRSSEDALRHVSRLPRLDAQRAPIHLHRVLARSEPTGHHDRRRAARSEE